MTKNTKLPNIPFTYQGSKLSELKRLSSFIPNNSKIIEPFIGTGVVSYKFGLNGSCLGNDLNKDIWNIWRLAKGRDKEFFDLSLGMMQEENRTQEYYYSRRSEFNDKYFRSDEYNAERGAYYYFLLNSCHAGLVRYGPNGFNTSYKLFLLNGRKYHAYTRLELLKLVSDKFKEVQNFNAIDFLKHNEKYFKEFDLIYLDPPYTQSNTTYVNSWSDDNLMELDEYLYWGSKKVWNTLINE